MRAGRGGDQQKLQRHERRQLPRERAPSAAEQEDSPLIQGEERREAHGFAWAGAIHRAILGWQLITAEPDDTLAN